MMVGDYYSLSSFDIMSYLVVDSTLYWIPFDGMFMIGIILVSTYPSEVLQLNFLFLTLFTLPNDSITLT